MSDAELFSALEQEMAGSRLRAHVYLTGKNLVVFATETTRDKTGAGNIGPAPVRKTIDKILGHPGGAERWLEALRARSEHQNRRPRRATWNTPNLVVTGVMPTLALAALLNRRNEYTAESRRALMNEAGIGNEADAAVLEQETFRRYRSR